MKILKRKLKCCNEEVNFFDYEDESVSNVRVNKSMLAKHLKKHNMTVLEYIDKYEQKLELCNFCHKHFATYDFELDFFNDVIEIKNLKLKHGGGFLCNDKECSKERGKLNSASFEFIMKKFRLTKEEAKQYRNKHQHSPFIKREDETDEQYGKRQSRSIEWYKEQYGDEELAYQKWKEHAEKISKANTKKSMIERYGKQKAEQICRKKANTLENFILRYGEEEGEQKYKEKVCKCTHLGRRINSKHIDSKQAYEFFKEIENILIKEGFEKDDIQYADGQRLQKCITYLEDDKCRILFIDFFIKSLNLCIQFQGSRWHAGEHNKEIFKQKSFVDVYYTWQECLEKDKHKQKIIRENGYDLYIIWDYEVQPMNRKETIEKLINHIKDRAVTFKE